MTTKIHLLADALGRPLRFLLTGGQVHESRTAEAMLDGVKGDAVITDKATATRSATPSRRPA